MKEYWILQAIFEVCHKLKIGGLEEISLPDRTGSRRRGRSVASREDEEKGYFKTDTIDAQVRARMRFSRIEPFLTELLDHPRVPFVGVVSLRMSKSEEDVKPFQGLVKEILPDAAAAGSAEETSGAAETGPPTGTEPIATEPTETESAPAAGDTEELAEPTVLVDMTLRVLSFQGRREVTSEEEATE
jgi:hypothetical protein